ncbi:hypothetical protein C8R45DRAFT_998946 [Mycena sanguinolenta]|nr:hypothetical protein C8R45DRAFT_998946 [Mycena sanguinolenta]
MQSGLAIFGFISSPPRMIRTPGLSRRPSGALVAIPEEAGAPGKLESKIDVVSAPQPPQIKRPIARRATRKGQPQTQKRPSKEPERECGICFELAVSPVRTLCCSHLFCAEHIMAWLHGPASDGLCPSCGAPNLDISLLALGHPGLTHAVPPPPPPTPRSASPPPSPTTNSAAPYASYPSTPAVLPPRIPDPGSTSSSEEEDATDYSLPALVYARALQTRRHMPHPFSSVVGVRGALGRVARIAVWLGLVAVLASRGRWVSD